MPEQNTVRKILKNEITWAIMIAVGVAGFYKTLVIPINNLQLAIAQIQQSINDSNIKYTSLDARITQNSNDIIKLQTEFTKK